MTPEMSSSTTKGKPGDTAGGLQPRLDLTKMQGVRRASDLAELMVCRKRIPDFQHGERQDLICGATSFAARPVAWKMPVFVSLNRRIKSTKQECAGRALSSSPSARSGSSLNMVRTRGQEEEVFPAQSRSCCSATASALLRKALECVGDVHDCQKQLVSKGEKHHPTSYR